MIESNGAFAAQSCSVIQELGFDPAKLNSNGSGISPGHPVGATGTIITTNAIAELRRTGGKFALVTMCIGGRQSIAAVFEHTRTSEHCSPKHAVTQRAGWPASVFKRSCPSSARRLPDIRGLIAAIEIAANGAAASGITAPTPATPSVTVSINSE